MRYLAILCIILTSTVCLTVGQRKKCGPIVREHSCNCKRQNAGMLKRDGDKILMCDGNEWKAPLLKGQEEIGSKKNPGYSCKDIQEMEGTTANGVYWITLTGKCGR